ncbi:MAG: hypothetical protein HQL59_06355 [Magnetococcales bacterium]|nr:hypothetical protein [Magnetococcales bacterium]
MVNPLHPDLMSDDERLRDVARILAAGILRGAARKREQAHHKKENVFLDKRAVKSVHGCAKGHQGESP